MRTDWTNASKSIYESKVRFFSGIVRSKVRVSTVLMPAYTYIWKGILMKIDKSELENGIISVVFDFWEIELMGYDIIKNEDRSGNFYSQLAEILCHVVTEHLENYHNYSIVSYIDNSKGLIRYKIMPHDMCQMEVVFDEMRKKNQKWLSYDGKLWINMDA